MSDKAAKIIYWITTGFFFLAEGVMPALTGHTELAKEGIRHLGYPEYFGTMLVVWKVLGSLALILPFIPNRIKEWAYGCFAVELICACVSHLAIDGLDPQSFFPLIAIAILAGSYLTHHKLRRVFATA